MSHQTLRIATWNVNSVRSRLPHLLDWLRSDHAPDIALLQELKVENDGFPRMEIEEAGYNVAIHGQKTYNGVGILSKTPLEDVITGLPGMEDDPQARYIEALTTVNGEVFRVASIYVPNGQEAGSEKFGYKMRFLEALHAHAQTLLGYREKLVLGGDYNVAPWPLDVYDPVSLDGTVCYHPAERAHLRGLLHLGLYDAFRTHYPDKHQYSWWDYRGNAWKMNKGLRIDHLLLSPEAADALEDCVVEESLRDLEKASDHAPVTGILRAGVLPYPLMKTA